MTHRSKAKRTRANKDMATIRRAKVATQAHKRGLPAGFSLLCYYYYYYAYYDESRYYYTYVQRRRRHGHCPKLPWQQSVDADGDANADIGVDIDVTAMREACENALSAAAAHIRHKI